MARWYAPKVAPKQKPCDCQKQQEQQPKRRNKTPLVEDTTTLVEGCPAIGVRLPEDVTGAIVLGGLDDAVAVERRRECARAKHCNRPFPDPHQHDGRTNYDFVVHLDNRPNDGQSAAAKG